MEKRFIMPAIVSIILTGIVLILNFLPLIYGEKDIIPIIPGPTASDVVISILIPFAFMFLMLFIGSIFAIILVRAHKLMKLNKYDYFVMASEKKMSGKWILLRSIFPGFLAINVGIYISLSASAPLFYHQGGTPSGLPATIEYTAIMVGIPIACLLVLPIWLMESSGLMCSRKTELYDRPVYPDIESVGQFYTQILKGFVGISTVVAYSLILYEYFTASSDESVILLVFIDPIIIIMLFLPISLLFEMRAAKTRAKLISKYEKLGITTTPKTVKIE